MTTTRRLFLRGAGTLTVGLPLLPSLLHPRVALAAALGPPRLVLIGQKQGAFGTRMFGDLRTKVPNAMPLFPGHEIKWGPIPASESGGRTIITPILQAASTKLTPRLLGQMNLVYGMDTPSAGGHNDSVFGQMVEKGPVPSVDQLVAWSPSYYRATSFKFRSIVAGYTSMSAYHSNPGTRSGAITKVASIGDPQKLWDNLFAGFNPPRSDGPKESTPRRKPLVDHVLDHYKLIRNSDRHLSRQDRFRLDAHMEMLAEVERRVSAAPSVVGAGCSVPQRSARAFAYNKVAEEAGLDTPAEQLRSPAESIALHQLYNDVIAAAFKCGLSRVAAIHPYEKNDPFSSYTKNWHDAAHDHEFDAYEEAYRNMFEGVVLDLATKLDEDELDGRTYLDNTLICWLNEHGALTHAATNKKVVTFGKAGGYFKTGLYLDVRNLSPKSLVIDRSGVPLHTGLTMNQWWANVLSALGIPRSEWERYGNPGGGYGPTAIDQGGSGRLSVTSAHYGAGPIERSGDKLPVIVG